MNNVNKESSSYNIENAIVFISIVIVFAFSNLKSLSVAAQFLVVGMIFIKVMMNKRIRITIHFLWMLTFIIWTLFIGLFSEYVMNSISQSINLFLKFLFYTSLIIFAKNKRKLSIIINAIVFSAIILLLRLIVFTPYSDWGTNRLGEAVGLNPNMVGLVLSYAIILSTFLYYENKNKKHLLFLIIFILVSLLTGSKKATLAVAIGPAILIFFKSKEPVRQLFNIFIIGSFAAMLYFLIIKVPFFYDVIGERIERSLFFLDSVNVDKSTLHRSIMIKDAFELFKQNPIFGIGLENFREYSIFDSYSHNNFTEVLSSTGLIGFTIYFSLPVIILLYSIYLNRGNNDYSLVISILTTILILDIANVSYRQLVTQIMIVISVVKFIQLKKSEMEYQKSIVSSETWMGIDCDEKKYGVNNNTSV